MNVRFAALILWTAVLSGCGGKPPGPEKFHVTGSVTLDGQPVESGVISFDSKDGKAGSGGIMSGSYSAEVPAGQKIVRINAQRDTGKKGMYGETVTEEIIPTKYNSDSKEAVEVKSSGENKFDFKLLSK